MSRKKITQIVFGSLFVIAVIVLLYLTYNRSQIQSVVCSDYSTVCNGAGEFKNVRLFQYISFGVALVSLNVLIALYNKKDKLEQVNIELLDVEEDVQESIIDLPEEQLPIEEVVYASGEETNETEETNEDVIIPVEESDDYRIPEEHNEYHIDAELSELKEELKGVILEGMKHSHNIDDYTVDENANIVSNVDIAKKLVEPIDLSENESNQLLDVILGIFVEELGKHEKIQLRGFGTFEVKKQFVVSRNNSIEVTKDYVKGDVVEFRPSKNLQNKMNKL